MLSKIALRPATRDDLPTISALHERVFGPGRFARTAYRVREGVNDNGVSRYCRVGLKDGHIVAAIRMTEVAVGGKTGALLLGPLVVAPEVANQGYGRTLIAGALDAARADGVKIIILVGDGPYYSRFGFKPVAAGQIAMPGPVNPARLLAAELVPGTLEAFKGTVSGR